MSILSDNEFDDWLCVRKVFTSEETSVRQKLVNFLSRYRVSDAILHRRLTVLEPAESSQSIPHSAMKEMQ